MAEDAGSRSAWLREPGNGEGRMASGDPIVLLPGLAFGLALTVVFFLLPRKSRRPPSAPGLATLRSGHARPGPVSFGEPPGSWPL
jgi:hypothetical protein